MTPYIDASGSERLLKEPYKKGKKIMATPTTLRAALNRIRALQADLQREQDGRRVLYRQLASHEEEIKSLRDDRGKLQLRLAASEAEQSHWQAKAEELVTCYLRDGKLDDFRIMCMPGAEPAAPPSNISDVMDGNLDLTPGKGWTYHGREGIVDFGKAKK